MFRFALRQRCARLNCERRCYHLHGSDRSASGELGRDTYRNFGDRFRGGGYRNHHSSWNYDLHLVD